MMALMTAPRLRRRRELRVLNLIFSWCQQSPPSGGLEKNRSASHCSPLPCNALRPAKRHQLSISGNLRKYWHATEHISPYHVGSGFSTLGGTMAFLSANGSSSSESS